MTFCGIVSVLLGWDATTSIELLGGERVGKANMWEKRTLSEVYLHCLRP